MNITSFNRANVRLTLAQLNSDLEKFCKDRGLALSTTTPRFSSSSFSVKIELAVSRLGCEDAPWMSTTLARNFITYCESFGLSEDLLGATFVHQGRLTRIVGINPRRSTYPIELQVVHTGEIRKCTKSFPKQFVLTKYVRPSSVFAKAA